MSCLFWKPLRPCGGAAGAQSAHKAGAFGPGFGLAGRGLRPPAAKRRRPPRRASYRQQKPGQTKKASEPRPFRLSKKWLAPLFRGFHSSLAPMARPGSYAGKPLLRKAFCGFAVHAAKSDESLKGLRSSIRQRFLDKLKGLGTEAFVAFTNAPNSSAVRGNRGLGSLCS